MGCYDTIIGKCPECGIENYFQSKSGDCCLDTYDIEEAPEDVMVDANRHTPEQCTSCEGWLFIDIDNKEVRIATEFEVSEKERKKEKARKNIEKFLKNRKKQ